MTTLNYPQSSFESFFLRSNHLDGYQFDMYLTIERGESSMSRLKGKVAVVTGASKGIGAGIAERFGAEGAKVIVNYSSSREGAARVVAKIKQAGGEAVAVQADVSKKQDVDRLFAETKKAFGTVDILVNNAGVYEFKPLENVGEEDFRKHFDTNVLGLILSSKEAAKLIGPEGGSIINIGSAISSLTPPGTAVYTATKGAVDAITGVFSKELGPKKIRVNSINPGMVDTEGARTAGFIGSDFEAGAVAQTPLGRIGQVDDIATVATFLASNDSNWITGELVRAGGGLR